MSLFMKIPLELRVIIYKDCLTVGKIFPYLEKQFAEEKMHGNAVWANVVTTPPPSLPMVQEKLKYSAPCVALLSVNHTVHEEASTFLYQRNTVVLPNAFWTAEFFQNCLKTAEKKLWLKDVELELSASDMSLDEKNTWYQSKGRVLPCGNYPSTMLNWDFVGWANLDLAEEPHNAWKRHTAEVVWRQELAPILDYTKLDRFTVKFGRSECPMLCCQMDVTACLAFQSGFAKGMVKNISLLSLGNWYDADSESSTQKDREVVGTKLPIVFDADGEISANRGAILVGEQIARWTRARELGLKDATRMWLQVQAQEEEQVGMASRLAMKL